MAARRRSTAWPGLTLDPGDRFHVTLANALEAETIIHWHGQIPPNAQDGVPGLPMPPLAPGETRSYDFEPRPGTHWMHSHVPLQELQLLAAPLIVRAPEDLVADRQEVALFLHDFSSRSPEEVLEAIHGGTGDVPVGDNYGGHGGHGGHGGAMEMDLNDHDWDAYLANDRTLNDPQVVRVERGGRVRLRIINGAAATVFWIDTGAVPARLIAVDGNKVETVAGSRFGIAMGQRLDLEIDLPRETGAWPILALREGARERTGLILATPGATIRKLAGKAETAAPAFDTDLGQEARLVAAEPLASRPVDRRQTLILGGSMRPYRWTIDGAVWGRHKPVKLRSGERIALTFDNRSMMGHPMHLHGHTFQVVGLNGRAVSGARRDTVYVPPMATVEIIVDAGEPARWMLHCHHMPHLAAGMMTEFAVAG